MQREATDGRAWRHAAPTWQLEELLHNRGEGLAKHSRAIYRARMQPPPRVAGRVAVAKTERAAEIASAWPQQRPAPSGLRVRLARRPLARAALRIPLAGTRPSHAVRVPWRLRGHALHASSHAQGRPVHRHRLRHSPGVQIVRIVRLA